MQSYQSEVPHPSAATHFTSNMWLRPVHNHVTLTFDLISLHSKRLPWIGKYICTVPINSKRSLALQSPKRWDFKDRLKESKDSLGRRSPGGRSLQSRGPEVVKLLSPRVLCVGGMSSFRMSFKLDRSGWWPASDRKRHSSARYAGVAPASDWCRSPAILNMTRGWTGSRCSCRNTSVMWSPWQMPVIRCAAAFRTDWRRWIGTILIHKKNA